MSGIQDDQHAVFNFRMFLVLNSIQFFSIQSELVFHPVQKIGMPLGTSREKENTMLAQ